MKLAPSTTFGAITGAGTINKNKPAEHLSSLSIMVSPKLPLSRKISIYSRRVIATRRLTEDNTARLLSVPWNLNTFSVFHILRESICVSHDGELWWDVISNLGTNSNKNGENVQLHPLPLLYISCILWGSCQRRLLRERLCHPGRVQAFVRVQVRREEWSSRISSLGWVDEVCRWSWKLFESWCSVRLPSGGLYIFWRSQSVHIRTSNWMTVKNICCRFNTPLLH